MARISLDWNTITVRSDDYRNAPKLGRKWKWINRESEKGEGSSKLFVQLKSPGVSSKGDS